VVRKPQAATLLLGKCVYRKRLFGGADLSGFLA